MRHRRAKQGSETRAGRTATRAVGGHVQARWHDGVAYAKDVLAKAMPGQTASQQAKSAPRRAAQQKA